MIVYVCTNETCPRHGMRTEQVCQARLWLETGFGVRSLQGGMRTCYRPARKDYN